jgi:hypothetical protein
MAFPNAFSTALDRVVVPRFSASWSNRRTIVSVSVTVTFSIISPVRLLKISFPSKNPSLNYRFRLLMKFHFGLKLTGYFHKNRF